MQMITHLYTNYDIITVVDIMESGKKMDAPYDPSVTIEFSFDKIENAFEFSQAGNSPFTTTQITTKALIQMFAGYTKTSVWLGIARYPTHAPGSHLNSSLP